MSKANQTSRRRFIKRTAMALASSCSAVPLLHRSSQGFASLAKAGPNLVFPIATRDRLAVASWPFRAYIDSPTNQDRDKSFPGMELPAFAVWVKTEFKLSGVEPLNQHFASLNDRYLGSFRESNNKNGVHIVNIPVDSEDSFYDADAGIRRKALANGKLWVDVARKVASPSIRTSIASAKNAKPTLDLVADQFHELADYAGNKDVVVNLENDNLISEDAFFLLEVLHKVNHPYLHALPDFCNSMQSRNEKFNYDAMAALFPRAYNICHVKQFEMTENGEQVHIDLAKTFEILKASNYRGYLSMEWEGHGAPHQGTRDLITACERNL